MVSCTWPFHLDSPSNPQYSLLNNYIKESAQLVSPDAKDVVKDHLNGFKTIFKRYKPDDKCPWPTDKPKPEDIKNIELNYVKTIAFLLNKYPPK